MDREGLVISPDGGWVGAWGVGRMGEDAGAGVCLWREVRRCVEMGLKYVHLTIIRDCGSMYLWLGEEANQTYGTSQQFLDK